MGLLLPAGKNGPAFLVGKNFDTFYGYNASENYALGIAWLSQMLRENRTNLDFATPWPTDDAGISRAQARQIQHALLALGYQIGAVDGLIGDGTRTAIIDFQQKNGLNPDGRAGQRLYDALNAHTMPSTATDAPQYQLPQTPSQTPQYQSLPFGQSTTPAPPTPQATPQGNARGRFGSPKYIVLWCCLMGALSIYLYRRNNSGHQNSYRHKID